MSLRCSFGQQPRCIHVALIPLVHGSQWKATALKPMGQAVLSPEKGRVFISALLKVNKLQPQTHKHSTFPDICTGCTPHMPNCTCTACLETRPSCAEASSLRPVHAPNTLPLSISVASLVAVVQLGQGQQPSLPSLNCFHCRPCCYGACSMDRGSCPGCCRC